MIYLLHYNRSLGRLISIREFADDQHLLASAARIELEISLLCASNGDEVVLLQAETETALKETHRRYFDSFDSMKARGKDS